MLTNSTLGCTVGNEASPVNPAYPLSNADSCLAGEGEPCPGACLSYTLSALSNDDDSEPVAIAEAVETSGLEIPSYACNEYPSPASYSLGAYEHDADVLTCTHTLMYKSPAPDT